MSQVGQAQILDLQEPRDCCHLLSLELNYYRGQLGHTQWQIPNEYAINGIIT